jgi:maltooligosyltrehalose trehalohydrolase
VLQHQTAISAGSAIKDLGATLLPDRRCSFRVWAPAASRVEVRLGSARIERLAREEQGHFSAILDDVEAGTPYLFRIDGGPERPDPASRLQSSGVHGPSRVVDLGFDWQDAAWRGVPLTDYVIYELHVGTFSRAGTFAAIIPELARLKKLGINAIELMPVAQFPGVRNWGYDGVYPFAAQDSYGGPKGLQRLVDECHRAGLCVVLDVVYNHLGPEGNYLAEFGPYFTDRYQTPWGRALNFDGPHSEGVRRFFLENALMWFERFHVDALRLDAVHAIIDRSAKPFLEELADEVHRRGERHGRHWYLIAESDLNDPRIVRPSEVGGHGLDAMWCDDFHHAAHVLLTGEKAGYYADYGRLEDMARAFRSAMSSPGEWSEFRQRRHGRPAPDLKPQQCVVFTQNHDQVGNRLLGERLDTLIDFERQKLAAGITCLSRFIPLLFMGQEYGETAPFQYFINHGDEALVEAVRRGRREEFASFAEGGEAPDPAARETTEHCVLNPELRKVGRHAVLHRLYETLLGLRKGLSSAAADDCLALEGRQVLLVQRPGVAWMVFAFSDAVQEVALPLPPGRWRRLVASADAEWDGPGCRSPSVIDSAGEVSLELRPHSFVVYGPERTRAFEPPSP